MERDSKTKTKAFCATTIVIVAFSCFFVCFVPLVADATDVHIPLGCGEQCTSLVNNAFDQCKQNNDGSCNIRFDSGTYEFIFPQSGSFISNGGVDNLNIIGQGTTIVVYGLNGAFYLANINNLKISGIAFDMARVPFTLGMLTSISNNQAYFQIDDLSEYSFPQNDTYDWLNSVQAVFQYDPSSNRIAAGSIDVYSPPNTVFSGNFDYSSNQYVMSLDNFGATMNENDYYVLRHQVYSYNAISVAQSSNVVIEDVTIYSCAGMAIYLELCNNVNIDNVSVRKLGDRPLSSNADAVHCLFCEGDVYITNSYFEGQGDDGLNVHGNYAVVQNLLSDTSAQVIIEQGWGPQEGDVVAFRDRSDFTVITTSTLNSIDSNGVAQFSSSLDGVLDYTFFGSVNRVPNSVVVANNIYKDNRARGNLLTASNVVAMNNIYDHTTGPGILIVPDCVNWYQSDVSNNVTIQNCTFIGNNYAMAFYPGDVFIAPYASLWQNNVPTGGTYVTWEIINNQFTISNNQWQQGVNVPAVTIYATDGVDISGNMVQTSGYPSSNFDIVGCQNVNTYDNTCDSGDCSVSNN